VLGRQAAGVDEMDGACGILDRVAERERQIPMTDRDRHREHTVTHRLRGRHAADGVRRGLRFAGRVHETTVLRALWR
jgi:hypothetical protein